MKTIELLFAVLLALAGLSISCDGDEATDGDGDGDIDADEPCASDEDCSDGLFCTGLERCDASDESADARGCVTPNTGPCDATEVCDEDVDQCHPDECAEFDLDGDGHNRAACGGDDCDDNDPNRYPGNTEVCDVDNHDEDCNPGTFGFQDLDGDGYVDEACCNFDEDGSSICGDDCNDVRPAAHPGNSEVCDGFDNDCNGEIDEGVLVTFWIDGDGDGFGSRASEAETIEACSVPAGYSVNNDDCDDTEAAIHPGAVEECDLVDNNCDDDIDSGCDCYEDAVCGSDVGECETGVLQCIDGTLGDRCIDEVAPAVEECNRLDDDCDGTIDEDVTILFCLDRDGDTHGTLAVVEEGCSPSPGYVASCTDCDDGNDTVHSGASELCDRIWNNCDDGSGTRTAEDSDSDGYAPRGTSLCLGGPLPRTDCLDSNANVHPHQTRYFNSPYCSRFDTWGCVEWSYDYDCDGVFTPEPVGSMCRSAGIGCEGGGLVSSGGSCGASVEYRVCSFVFGEGCRSSIEMRILACR